jgi:hypothetical protein
MVVLDKLLPNSEIRQRLLVVAFEKKAALVFEDPGFQKHQVRNGSGKPLHDPPSFGRLSFLKSHASF